MLFRAAAISGPAITCRLCCFALFAASNASTRIAASQPHQGAAKAVQGCLLSRMLYNVRRIASACGTSVAGLRRHSVSSRTRLM
jgi:hypothetical protein